MTTDDTTYGAWWDAQMSAQRATEAAASERVSTDEFCRRVNVQLGATHSQQTTQQKETT